MFTPEEIAQRKLDYQRSWDAQQRLHADPERMAELRRKIIELDEKYGAA